MVLRVLLVGLGVHVVGLVGLIVMLGYDPVWMLLWVGGFNTWGFCFRLNDFD